MLNDRRQKSASLISLVPRPVWAFRLKSLALMILLLVGTTFLSACSKDTGASGSGQEAQDSALTEMEAEELPVDMAALYPNIQSEIDFNENGIDDYTDFVKGARKDCENFPRYNPDYVSENNGYPDPQNGVCTDVIWRAFKEAGYSLRSMLNADIARRRSAYTNIEGRPDPKIDFRRVKTLRPFFEKYALSLETEMTDPNQWQAGDIILFNPHDFHIGILSDKRNDEGYPLVMHNMGQAHREEDYLSRMQDRISGHFRFDASQISQEVLRAWEPGEDGQ